MYLPPRAVSRVRGPEPEGLQSIENPPGTSPVAPERSLEVHDREMLHRRLQQIAGKVERRNLSVDPIEHPIFLRPSERIPELDERHHHLIEVAPTEPPERRDPGDDDRGVP